MVPIVIASLAPFCGKNVVAVGIARKLSAMGKKVGYFKPIGPLLAREDGVLTDEDTVFFKKVLHLDEPLATLCPIPLSEETVSEILRGSADRFKERIVDAYKAASDGKDVMLIMSMGNLSCGETLGYRMSQFVRDMGAKIVIVDRCRWPVGTLDGLVGMKEVMGDHLAAVFFNKVPALRLSQIEQAITPFLKSRGIEVFGSIPADKILQAVQISDIVSALDGKVLCGGDKLDNLVEDFSIGAMNPDAALRFFRRVPNKGVITGGDRADIHIAALETSTRCLILTGNLYPNERILERAARAGMPVMLVASDTSRAISTCQRLQRNLSLHSDAKVARIEELMDANFDWDHILSVLGID